MKPSIFSNRLLTNLFLKEAKHIKSSMRVLVFYLQFHFLFQIRYHLTSGGIYSLEHLSLVEKKVTIKVFPATRYKLRVTSLNFTKLPIFIPI